MELDRICILAVFGLIHRAWPQMQRSWLALAPPGSMITGPGPQMMPWKFPRSSDAWRSAAARP